MVIGNEYCNLMADFEEFLKMKPQGKRSVNLQSLFRDFYDEEFFDKEPEEIFIYLMFQLYHMQVCIEGLIEDQEA